MQFPSNMSEADQSKFIADYTEAANRNLDSIPLDEGVEAVTEALRSIIDPEGGHPIPASLQDRIQDLSEFLNEPQLYVTDIANFSNFQVIVAGRIAAKVRELSNATPEVVERLAAGQKALRERAAADQEKLRSRLPPSSAAQTLTEERWLEQEQERFEREGRTFERLKGEARRDGAAVSRNIHMSGLTEQGWLIETAKLAAAQNGLETAMYIANYGIKSQDALLEIAEIAINQNHGAADFLQNFKIGSNMDVRAQMKFQDALFKLEQKAEFQKFKAQAALDGASVSRAIANSSISDQKQLIEIAKIAARQNGLATSQHIANYGITDPGELLKIATVAIAQNEQSSEFLSNYGIAKERVSEILELIPKSEVESIMIDGSVWGEATSVEDLNWKEIYTAMLEFKKRYPTNNLMLVRVPSLSMNEMEQLVKDRTGFRNFSPGIKEELGDKKKPVHWVLMSTEVLEGSRNKPYCEQAVLARNVPGFDVPTLRDATACIFAQYLKSGTRLYSNDPWTYTRCREQVGSYQTNVGCFAPSGVGVVCRSFDDVSIGVAAMRKF